MGIIIKKFGGATLADSEKIRAVAKSIAMDKIKTGHQMVVVVSAMGKSTDAQIRQIKSISETPNSREVDLLLSTGELASAALLSIALNAIGCEAISMSGVQAGVLTDSHHTSAAIQWIDGMRIEEALAKQKVVILAGFQGINAHGDVTTLGRGGSDTTALAIAARLAAKRCEILKDVPAVFTADPQLVPEAHPIHYLSYNALLEMTYWGAKVLQYRSVEIAKKYDVPIFIGPAHSEAIGTTVKETPMIEDSEVLALNSHRKVLEIHSHQSTLMKALNELHHFLENKNFPLPQILHTENAPDGMSFFVTGPEENMEAIKKSLEFSRDFETYDLCSVTATCRGTTRPELLNILVEILDSNGIQVSSVAVSSMSVTLFMEERLRAKAIQSLHAILLKPAKVVEKTRDLSYSIN